MSCLRSIAALILLQCGEYTSLECVVLQPNRKKTNERCTTNKDASGRDKSGGNNYVRNINTQGI